MIRGKMRGKLVVKIRQKPTSKSSQVCNNLNCRARIMIFRRQTRPRSTRTPIYRQSVQINKSTPFWKKTGQFKRRSAISCSQNIPLPHQTPPILQVIITPLNTIKIMTDLQQVSQKNNSSRHLRIAKNQKRVKVVTCMIIRSNYRAEKSKMLKN